MSTHRHINRSDPIDIPIVRTRPTDSDDSHHSCSQRKIIHPTLVRCINCTFPVHAKHKRVCADCRAVFCSIDCGGFISTVSNTCSFCISGKNLCGEYEREH